jgi:hypothetical protein
LNITMADPFVKLSDGRRLAYSELGGALVNTYRLQDKTWFAVLLAGGLLGLAFGLLGFAAMVAYLVAGPDGMSAGQPRNLALASRPSSLAPTA